VIMQIAEALKRLETGETSSSARDPLYRDADSGCTICQGQRDKSKPHAIPGLGRSLYHDLPRLADQVQSVGSFPGRSPSVEAPSDARDSTLPAL
jgi:hypothetical protein